LFIAIALAGQSLTHIMQPMHFEASKTILPRSLGAFGTFCAGYKTVFGFLKSEPSASNITLPENLI
jgi:hypothetical protein